MKELIDWAEAAGLENLRFRLQTSEVLAKDVNTTLTILLAGIGGIGTYAMHAIEQHAGPAIMWGAATVVVWLMLDALLLVLKCVLTSPIPCPTNEPEHLYQKEFDLLTLREVELKNIQKRINQAMQRNWRIAFWLDRVRLLAAASPLVFLLAALLAS